VRVGRRRRARHRLGGTQGVWTLEQDDIEDFEGWDLIDVPQEQDQNDMAWLFP
jgi:hypothetical protein